MMQPETALHLKTGSKGEGDSCTKHYISSRNSILELRLNMWNKFDTNTYRLERQI